MKNWYQSYGPIKRTLITLLFLVVMSGPTDICARKFSKYYCDIWVVYGVMAVYSVCILLASITDDFL